MAGTSVTQLPVLIEECPLLRVTLGSFKGSRGGRLVGIDVGMAGVDKYSTTVVLEEYCDITTCLLLEWLTCKLLSMTCCSVHTGF